MKILDTILHQLAQNSTWRGIILLATSCGVALTPSHQEAIVAAGLAPAASHWPPAPHTFEATLTETLTALTPP